MKNSAMAALAILSVAGTAMALPPNTMTTLFVDGDDAGGVGAVTFVDKTCVNNSGTYMVWLDTNNTDTNIDAVLMRDGVLALQEGGALPGGLQLSSVNDLSINNNGDSGWNFFLDVPPSPIDSGVFFNQTAVFLEGAFSTAPGLTPGVTPFIGFFGARMNDNNRMLLVASVDDPAIGSTVDQALIRIDYNAGAGTYTETLLAKEGDVLPGGATILTLSTGPHNYDINNAGSVMYIAESSGGITDTVYVDTTPVMQEGQPSFEAGRNWEILSDRPLDLNNNGEWVFRANLAGDTANDEVIVKNGVAFVREGQSLPAIAPHALTAFGSTPIFIDDSGNVVWFGDWNDPDTTRDTGLFWNEELLIQEGVTALDTVLGNLVIDDVRGIESGFSMSDNGAYIMVRVLFDDPGSTAQIDGLVKIAFEQSTCGSADFDGDGDTGTDADIEAFFACLGGNCCVTCGTADFDGDGDVGTDADIEAFFRVLGGGNC
jgi:hypothetical protein